MTTEQKKQLDAASKEMELAQKALADKGVETSANIIFRGTVDYEVADELEPSSVLTGTFEAGVRKGETWTIYLFTILGNTASYGSATLPKGTYRLIGTQSKKDAKKGGLGWLKVA